MWVIQLIYIPLYSIANPALEVRSSATYTLWHCTIPPHLTSASGFITVNILNILIYHRIAICVKISLI